jgi:hypothetical protein
LSVTAARLVAALPAASVTVTLIVSFALGLRRSAFLAALVKRSLSLTLPAAETRALPRPTVARRPDWATWPLTLQDSSQKTTTL